MTVAKAFPSELHTESLVETIRQGFGEHGLTAKQYVEGIDDPQAIYFPLDTKEGVQNGTPVSAITSDPIFDETGAWVGEESENLWPKKVGSWGWKNVEHSGVSFFPEQNAKHLISENTDTLQTDNTLTIAKNDVCTVSAYYKYKEKFIGKDPIVLHNLSTGSSYSWKQSNPGQYGLDIGTKETNFDPEHLYYNRAYGKFTTTNQTPIQMRLYQRFGVGYSDRKDNVTANTEYFFSLCFQSADHIDRKKQQIYCMPSSAIDGVITYGKESLLIDLTESPKLLEALALIGITTNDQIKAWCDEYIPWFPSDEPLVIGGEIESLLNGRIPNHAGLTSITPIEGGNRFTVDDFTGVKYYRYTNIPVQRKSWIYRSLWARKESGNQTSHINIPDGDGYLYNSNGTPIATTFPTDGSLLRKYNYGGVSSTNTLLLIYIHDLYRSSGAITDSTLTFDIINSLAIDTYVTGLRAFMSLLGISSIADEVKWLNTYIPYFERKQPLSSLLTHSPAPRSTTSSLSKFSLAKSTGTEVLSNNQKESIPPTKDVWQRGFKTATYIEATTALPYIQANTTFPIHVTGLMLEKKPFIGPWCETTRPASYLKFSSLVNWNNSWSIVYWKKIHGSTNNRDSIGSLWWGFNGDSHGFSGSGVSISWNAMQYTWMMYALVYNGTQLQLRVYGGKDRGSGVYGLLQSQTLTTTVSGNLELGSYQGTLYGNNYYRDLIAYQKALTNDEVNLLYNRRLRFFDDHSSSLNLYEGTL